MPTASVVINLDILKYSCLYLLVIVITSIRENTFYECAYLTGITIPASVTSIGGNAFYGCTSLTSVSIPANVTSIGQQAFAGCTGLTSVTIPNSVTSIGEWAFSGCTSLTSVTIPNSVTVIEGGVFSGCTGLTSVTIPNSVTSIGDSAFGGCESLTNITIPNSVTVIGDYAFSGCTSLASVTFEGTIPSSGFPSDDIYVRTFPGNLRDKFYATDTNNGTPGTYFTANPGEYASWVMHTQLFTILAGLPDNTADNPHSISLNVDNAAGLGDALFAHPNKYVNLDLSGSTFTSIGDRAFRYCTSLTGISIPNSVTSIGERAFGSCASLTSITIPANVTSVGYYAFISCASLASVTFEGTIHSSGINYDAFPDGDLQNKFYATDWINGTPGTYTTANPGNGAVWTRQP